MKRAQEAIIRKDLEKKMVLLSGPRQVGKSYLAHSLMGTFTNPMYLNYDNREDRRIIENMLWPGGIDLLVLDELYKMPGWKNHLKGIYDVKPREQSILVTGSARLDTFRQGGDSLAGRYYHHRLLPLSPAEVRAVGGSAAVDLNRFLERGGYPEPYLAESIEDSGRWRRQYLDGLIRKDILTLENIRELRSMTMLVELLRSRVGAPLSYQSLAEDLSISPHTVKRHLEILEALFIVFKVFPHARDIARSTSKQPKVYFYDSALAAGGRGPAFENLVAISLLKRQHFLEDRDGRRRSLAYLRTKEKREIDFVLVEEDEPTHFVEAKWSERELSPQLLYFSQRYGVASVQLVADLRQERDEQGVAVRRALDWLTVLEA